MSFYPNETRQFYRRNPTGDTFSSKLELHSESLSTLQQTDTSIIIKVHAVSLNYRDANMLKGTNPWDIRADGIPCSDAAGEVVYVGPRVSKFQVGDRVTHIFDQKSLTGREQEREWLGGEVDGVLATHVVFDEENVLKIPDGLTYAEAACLVCAGVTAWSGLMDGGRVVPGSSVLIQGKRFPST
jgi:NADPH:quinone reductase-like Zn-dependent oxidoreductase